MAGKIVDVTLNLIDKVSTPLNNIGKKLTESSNNFTKAGRQIERAGKRISSVGSGLTKTVTAPIVALGAASVVSFGEVDKSLKLVASTMGEEKWAAADLESAMKKAASNSVFSMQEAADASLNFARQGFDAKQAAEMLEPALALAAGTATDLSEVTSGLGNTLKVFEAQGLSAEHAADVFAKAQAQANTSTTELFEAMSVGSSIFNTVGWSMEDLATVTDVFGDNFISGSEGATAMKTGLAKLVSPAKDGAKWIEKLNLDIVNSDGTMKSFVTVQEQLNKAFADLTQEEQMQAASALFGKNQMGKWLTLINTAPDTVQKYRNSLDDVTGTAGEMSDALLSGVGGSIEKLKSTFDVFRYEIGNSVGNPVQGLIDKATGLIDKFNNLDDASKNNIIRFAMIAAAVGPALLVFGKTVIMVGKVVTAFGRIGAAFKAFTSVAGLLTSPVGVVIITLIALVAVIAVVIKNWDKIKATFLNVTGVIQEKWGNFTGYMSERMTALREGWSNAWNGVKNIFTGVFDAVVTVGKTKINAVIELINKAISGLNKIGFDIPDWVPAIGGKSFKIDIPMIPALAVGTSNWSGGLAQISEKGGEIVDLPTGSRVYPHDESVQKAYRDGARTSNITIAKLADSIIVREDADIDRIAQAIADKLEKVSQNLGGGELGYLY